MKFLLFIIIEYIIVVVAKNSYIVTVPKLIRPEIPADISIQSLKSGIIQAQVTVWLQDKDNQTLTSVNQSIRLVDQKPDVVNLKIPSKLENAYEYKIRVKATGGLEFDKTATDIDVSRKIASLFIQTDRQIYKPGDLVQFRALGTNHKLKIFDDPMDIIIKDPRRNILQQFIGVKPVFGVFAGSFQLSSLTTIGEWTIHVEQRGEKNKKVFSVERYVLPKFEVNVDLPKLQLKTDKFFVASITAMYTFGKPVEGDVQIIIREPCGQDSITNIEKKLKIKGKATIKVLMSEILPRYYIEVFAKVTETVTGIEAYDTSSGIIYDTPEKVEFSSSMPYVFKPGLKYTIMMRANQIDGSPLKPPLGAVNVTVTYSFSSIVSTEKTPAVPSGDQVLPLSSRFSPSIQQNSETLWTKLVQIPASGILVLEAIFPSNAESGTIEASYRKATAYWSGTSANSPSGNYIQVSVINDAKAMPEKSLPLMIDTTEKISSCTYKIFSKGSLLSQGSFKMENLRHKRQQISITNSMAPQATLLVYYTRHDGEIVADALQFPIEKIFENKVTVQFNKQSLKPAENVYLELTADPGSIVNVLAVDKSVLLLRKRNDITKQDVLSELQQYEDYNFSRHYGRWDSSRPIYAGGSDAYLIFNTVGVYVLTDAVQFQYLIPDHFSIYRGPRESMGDSCGHSNTARRNFGGAAAGGSLSPAARTRKNFPVTWLWFNVTVSNNGKVAISVTAPDTITEWITSAFAVNPYTGLGIASESAKLRTFQDFFMRFELPLSAIRGEIIILQITVFNFLQEDLEVCCRKNRYGPTAKIQKAVYFKKGKSILFPFPL